MWNYCLSTPLPLYRKDIWGLSVRGKKERKESELYGNPFCKDQRVTGGREVLAGWHRAPTKPEKVMRLLTWYSRGYWSNKRGIELKYRQSQNSFSESCIRQKQTTKTSTPVACVPSLSVSSSSSRMNSWRRSTCDWQNETAKKRRVRTHAPTSWEDQNQEWLEGDGSLMGTTEECWCWPTCEGGGGMRIRLIPVWATCRLKPVASVEDTHTWCFSSSKCYVKLNRSLDFITAP